MATAGCVQEPFPPATIDYPVTIVIRGLTTGAGKITSRKVLFTHAHAHTHAHTRAHTYVRTRTRTHTHAHTHAHKHTHTLTRTRTHTNIRTHTYTHMCTRTYKDNIIYKMKFIESKENLNLVVNIFRYI